MTVRATSDTASTIDARPLGREAAAAAIASRLATLGHPPDLLDGEAVQALVAHAGGSATRLRAALASTLFLASTEDAARIGRKLVERAIQDSLPSATPVGRNRRPFAGAAIGGALLLAIAVALWTHRPHPKSAIPPAPRALSAAKVAAPAPNIRPAPQPVGTAAPPPAEPDPTAILPGAPPSAVLITFSPHRTGPSGSLDLLVARLHAAGIGQVETRPGLAARARRPIAYFFADDLPLARTVLQAVTDSNWPLLERNSLAPLLVLSPTGLVPRRPGQIEIHLP